MTSRNDQNGRPGIGTAARVVMIIGMLFTLAAMGVAIWVADWRMAVTGVLFLAASVVCASALPRRNTTGD